MKLSFKERLIFVGFYPEKGSLTDQILVRDINEKIQITQEEMTKVNYKIEETVPRLQFKHRYFTNSRFISI